MRRRVAAVGMISPDKLQPPRRSIAMATPHTAETYRSMLGRVSFTEGRTRDELYQLCVPKLTNLVKKLSSTDSQPKPIASPPLLPLGVEKWRASLWHTRRFALMLDPLRYARGIVRLGVLFPPSLQLLDYGVGKVWCVLRATHRRAYSFCCPTSDRSGGCWHPTPRAPPPVPRSRGSHNSPR